MFDRLNLRLCMCDDYCILWCTYDCCVSAVVMVVCDCVWWMLRIV